MKDPATPATAPLFLLLEGNMETRCCHYHHNSTWNSWEVWRRMHILEKGCTFCLSMSPFRNHSNISHQVHTCCSRSSVPTLVPTKGDSTERLQPHSRTTPLLWRDNLSGCVSPYSKWMKPVPCARHLYPSNGRGKKAPIPTQPTRVIATRGKKTHLSDANGPCMAKGTCARGEDNGLRSDSKKNPRRSEVKFPSYAVLRRDLRPWRPHGALQAKDDDNVYAISAQRSMHVQQFRVGPRGTFVPMVHQSSRRKNSLVRAIAQHVFSVFL